MNVICVSAFTEIRPKLDFGSITKYRLKNHGFFAVGGLCKSETNINPQDFHFILPEPGIRPSAQNVSYKFIAHHRPKVKKYRFGPNAFNSIFGFISVNYNAE
jgi:hypothetical protein